MSLSKQLVHSTSEKKEGSKVVHVYPLVPASTSGDPLHLAAAAILQNHMVTIQQLDNLKAQWLKDRSPRIHRFSGLNQCGVKRRYDKRIETLTKDMGDPRVKSSGSH